MSQLPIETVMPQLLAAVSDNQQIILKAAPGAGKSTCFPLRLLQANLLDGKIIVLEPRRLAARNIADYLAKQLGEPVGKTVGFRVRGETKTSRDTRLEIVTEGVLTRMIQSDPELSGVAMVMFDEYHERSLNADTGLALCLEIQQALREDLKLVVMSATLDQHALAQMLPSAAYIESDGRAFAVEVRYQPLAANDSFTAVMASKITALLGSESGSILAFLPGVAAIKNLEQRLQDLANDVDICPLYGQLSPAMQQQAIAPAAGGRRKVVLATNIAETSLTIEGIRIVVDSGLERQAWFDLRSGISRLEQTRIAQSSAEQRAGRAGRIEPGICVRLYSEAQLKQQAQVPVAEILRSDLSSLAMELAQWGTSQVSDLCWLDVPPAAAMAQSRDLLQTLGLMDENLMLTPAGQQVQALGVDPRIGAMLCFAKQDVKLTQTAALLAALLEDPEKQQIDVLQSLHRFEQGRHQAQKRVAQRYKQLAQQMGCPITNHVSDISSQSAALLLCAAFPDRIAQRRSHSSSTYRLANGHGAMLDEHEPLANEAYLIVVDLMRSTNSREASRILMAAALDIKALESQMPALFRRVDWVDWDDMRGRLVAEQRKQLGQLVIERQALASPPREKMTQALLSYVRRNGLEVLHWTPQAAGLLERARCGAMWMADEAWPPLTNEALLEKLDDWLEPYLIGVHSVKLLNKVDVYQALMAYLGWPLNQSIDQWLPTHYVLPTGTSKAIRYQQGKNPVLSVRMQEVFGEQTSPTVANGKINVVMELLSPAQRPLQVTQDLAAFWQGAYKEVQKEMKGRYPKHVWPDDPATHVATTKTKRQLNS
ncbi:ATP-dependent helicase HrpB [Vibrio xiamenensis]|uniref:ATP-dependent helicase HrpB n=1 Tax=Vibrio xiamenensis TaxID=861298 RepID=A0A1G8C269_9VIBR|nr:ATP-dependent helicase HrpB [Vibrio xiamenensis]SDH39453.1 ATP-dependent helicase HrpB [Vibrio xiamenensis]